MTNWSKEDGKDCAACRWSDVWKGFNPPVLVCRNPGAIARYGGPRSCQDIVRAPRGLCSPAGTLWEKKPPPEDYSDLAKRYD